MTGRAADDAPIEGGEFAEALAESFGHVGADDAFIVLAVSGGPDSTALMQAAARWSADCGGPRLTVATVDHRLRPGSGREAAEVGVAAAKLGVPHRCLAWASSPGRPVSQEMARAARYRLLLDSARETGARALVTAHTLDDQAETLLMRMAAGSGLTGLAGMAAASRRDGLLHLRPFLRFPKARLLATCRRENWPFVDDPANVDPCFARSRWRALAPTLAQEGLDAGRLGRLADRLRRADDALAVFADRAFASMRRPARPGVVALDLAALAAEPFEIVIRAVEAAILCAPIGPAQPGSTPEPSARLQRLETCVGAFLAAVAEGGRLRRTLSGRLLTLDPAGVLRIAAEPPRSRGHATR